MRSARRATCGARRWRLAVAVRGGGPVGLEEDERPVIVLTFGYPAGARDPQRRSPEEWVAGADRKAFEEVVRRL